MEILPPDSSITLSIESNLNNVCLLGLAIRAICSFVESNKNDSYDTELGIVEAVNNVIMHSYNSEPSHETRINVSIYRDKIVFRILDTGRGIDAETNILKCLPVDFTSEEIDNLPECGMGLGIINSVMDGIHYEVVERTNILTLIKIIKKKV